MNVAPRLFACTVLAFACAAVHGFEINPSHNPDGIKRSLKVEYQRFLSRLSQPTHEKLTELSMGCAESRIAGRQWCNLPPADMTGAVHFDESAVVRGVRWNDDPNNFFPAQQEVTWFFWLKAAAYTKNITDVYPLEYRSHYGDLQFLHGMGSKDRPAGATHGRIIEWAHFAFDVAVGRIAPDARLATLEGQYPFVRLLTGTSKRNWTVRKLFTNVNDVLWPHYKDVPADDNVVAALALGALLHTVQDSFSHSHVERDLTRDDGRFPVIAWLDYSQQDPDCHGGADKLTGWIEDDASPKPAIAWGAWIVRNAMLKVKWEGALEDTLRTQVFELDHAARESYPGAYAKCSGA